MQEGRLGRRTAFFFGETIRVAGSKAKNKLVTGRFSRFKGKLGDVIELVFDIHVYVFGSKKGSGFVQDFKQGPRSEAMIKILGNPGLHSTNGVGSKRSATIDELLLYQSHFGDVGVCRYRAACG